MMLIAEWVVRSTLLGILVGLALTIFRVRDPRVERSAWRIVLVSSLLMPLLLKLGALSPVRAPSLPLDAAELVTLSANSSQWIWQDAVVVIVGVICIALLLRHSIGVAKWWAIRRRATPLSKENYGDLDIRASEEVRSPAAIFSTILVPADFPDWSSEAQRLAIGHERAHIMSKDFYFQWLAQLHRHLFWFNPFAWWLAARLSVLNEHISDDAATNEHDDRATYARVLLSLAQRATTSEQLVPMIKSASLGARIERILRETSPARTGVTKTMLVSCALILTVAAVTLTSRGNATTDRTQLDPAGSNIVLPKSNPNKPLSAPTYPPAARRLGEHGTVVLKLHVLEDGSVADAAIERSSGYPDLDYAAYYEAFRWRLDPGTIDGTPSRMWGRFAVRFQLPKE